MGNVCCCVQVEERTVGFTKRFGRFDRTLEPGCHFVPWICGYQLAGKLSLQWQSLLVKCRTKTKDNDFVNVVAHVQYRVHQERQYEAFYMQSNPRRQIQGYVLKVIGAMVAVRNMDEVSGQRDEIAKAIMEEMKEAVGLNGYEILQVQIWDVSLDKGLEQAMIEAKNAKRKAEVEIHDGQEASTSAAM
ncbi:hypersensitive-induced reaction 1 protein-like [Syzygium oleosum]|uniref:hypersensitive-induced reaction 1 protein-like n=1 Tax=Syzygium oleosum TaxID=219896 RepID=UPI0024BBBE93|nr:hypersensitive-induced reaction 1 protein-like [Syzygium oleosum]